MFNFKHFFAVLFTITFISAITFSGSDALAITITDPSSNLTGPPPAGLPELPELTFKPNLYLEILPASAFSSNLALPSSGGSGGGGSSLPALPNFRSEIRQELRLDGFEINLYAQNLPARTETWTWYDNQGNKHFESQDMPKEAYANLWISIEQGALGKNYLPVKVDSEIHRYDDQGRFYYDCEFILITDERVTAEMVGWTAPPAMHQSFNAFGLSFDSNASIEHQQNWEWQDDDLPPIITETDDINGHASFSMRDVEFDHASFSVRGSKVTEWVNGEYFGFEAIRIPFDVDATYMGDLETFNSAVPLGSSAVPEPTTMILLGLGALGVIRRRRRSS